MIHPQIGRLQFLKSTFGALGFSLLPGSRLWAAPRGWEPRGRAELVFGFVTDTHIRRDGRPERETIWRHTPDTYLRNAFRFFRDAGVDAVMHGGDMAHRGLRCEMQFTADVWNEVFPGDRLPDGRPVAKLFVTGNHEWNRNNSFEFKVYPDPDVRERNVLHNDMPRHWREVWGEPYTKAWHKVVKGYHFFGEHWEDAYGDVVPLLQKDAQSLKGRKPFFLIQHLMPGCAECGSRTSDALKSFPNAIVMFGHWHNSSADLTTIHHTDCVMVNGPSLRGNGRNRIPGYRPDARTQTDHDTIQHGYLVRVYSDMVVFERHDFRHGGKVGPDLVLPLGEYDSKPFSSSSLAATIGAPAFAAAAKPTLTDLGEHVALDIPPATAREASRVYAYDIAIAADGNRRLRKSAYAAGCDYAANHPLAKGPTRVLLNPSELPGGKRLRVAVRPLSSLGTAGAACGTEVPAFFGADRAVVKVGTFNIRTADLEARDPVPWKTRAPWVAQAILAHDFDILGLQEVVAVQLDDLAEALKRGYGHIGVCRDDGARAGEAAPIFYSKARFELLDSGNFWLSEQPDVPGVKSWDTAFTRICTWGKFRDRVSGKQFAFFNTHLDHRGAVAKRKGMELIVARLRPHLDAGLPGIITGDFNTVEGEGPYNVAAANFRDAVMVSATKPVGPWRSAHGWRWRAAKDELTFDAAVACPKEERATRAFHDRIGGHRIDHVFVSPQIRVRSVTTHTDANGRTYVSDHFPVSAVLEF
ncbi:MAG: endonuclease/exonuclease/phosphatase family protein [Kiritimatiellia bacterium]